MNEEKPNYAAMDWGGLIQAMFANWCPFPTKSYCESVGWEVNKDGTVDTPGGRFPTQDLCEVRELEQLYKRTV